jgi:hypothetical protein
MGTYQHGAYDIFTTSFARHFMGIHSLFQSLAVQLEFKAP